jgi:hypothetical protein
MRRTPKRKAQLLSFENKSNSVSKPVRIRGNLKVEVFMSYKQDEECNLPLDYFVGKGPKTYQRSDERIQKEIWTLPNRQMKYHLENKKSPSAWA